MRFYRVLLRFYPAAFRSEYEDELSAVFVERRREATNIFAVAALWCSVLFDALITAAQVHWDVLQQDLRYAARTLARSPGFALTAILVTAIGIGANTAAFSLTDHVLIRPLPFADFDRLVKVWEDETSRGYSALEPSPANYRDWKNMNTVFEQMAAYRSISVNMVGQGIPERMRGTAMTSDMLPMLGVNPAIGRVFAPSDDREGAPGTVLLSYALWQGRFGGDPAVIGRKLVLDGEAFIVIGVMQPDFSFPTRESEIWTAMRFAPSDFEDRTNNYLRVIAKLKRGVSIDQARAAMKVVAAQLEKQYPKENAHIGISVFDLRDEISHQSRLIMKTLFAAALCVLLIACTNLANLSLARALTRRKELAVRASLGAGRERLVRQLLTESLLLALCGGALGMFIAVESMPLLMRFVPLGIPIGALTVDGRVLAFALLLVLATGIGFGVMPALRAVAAGDLREGSRSGVGGRRERLRGTLIVVEVTASVVLLVSSGLLMRALWRVKDVDPGFRAQGVLTLRTSFPMPKYEKVATREQFYRRVLSDITALPGVESAAYISFLPMSDMGGGIWPVTIVGQAKQSARPDYASLRYVTPGYFKVLRIPLLAGRDFRSTDTRDGQYVAIVSQSFVQHYWPGENPIGRHFQMAFSERTIAGVVGDVRVRGLERSSEPQVYIPEGQVADGAIIWYTPKDLAIRASGDVHKLVPAVRGIINAADPEQPISDVHTLSEMVDANTAVRQLELRVLGSFAMIAFLLAAIGIHGLLSFAVSMRTQEIGVRMALGAQAGDIIGTVVGEGVLLAAVGIAIGTVLAYAAAVALRSLLAGVRPYDVGAFSAAIALSAFMVIAGSLLPAMRAVRIDPASTIRTE